MMSVFSFDDLPRELQKIIQNREPIVFMDNGKPIAIGKYPTQNETNNVVLMIFPYIKTNYH